MRRRQSNKTSDALITQEIGNVSVDLVTNSDNVVGPTPYPRKFLDVGKKMNVDEKFYVFGGEPVSNRCWVYYLRRNTWESLPPMKQKRRFCRAALIDDEIYITGGQNEKYYYHREYWNDDNVLSSVEIFNIRKKSWTSGPAMISPHEGHATVTVGSKLFVLGGSGGRKCECLETSWEMLESSWIDNCCGYSEKNHGHGERYQRCLMRLTGVLPFPSIKEYLLWGEFMMIHVLMLW